MIGAESIVETINFAAAQFTALLRPTICSRVYCPSKVRNYCLKPRPYAILPAKLNSGARYKLVRR